MTPYDLAQRFVGVAELDGAKHHPLIVWWLSLCGIGGLDFAGPDEIPWCSAFVNGVAWELRLPRSKSALARSWLRVGVPVPLVDAEVGSDVVILQRGSGHQPGADVINAPGHVGFYAGHEGQVVLLLGGNQNDCVSVSSFPSSHVLGIRRLA